MRNLYTALLAFDSTSSDMASYYKLQRRFRIMFL